MTYTLTTTVDLPWAEALDRTREALSGPGIRDPHGNQRPLHLRSQARR